MLGVMFVELFQAWQVIPHPGRQLLKLTVVIAVSLLVGTLPYIDNWSHVGGFAFGACKRTHTHTLLLAVQHIRSNYCFVLLLAPLTADSLT